ncbi:MAG TPA: GvpL/GvpF family gas vesicle protein [Ktedonobacterales bacterium]
MAERYYVYAITGSDIRLPEHISGFGGELFVLTDGDLGAVVSRVSAADTPREGASPTMEDLVLHERLVEAIHGAGRALPVRFGAVLADAGAVTSALRRHATALRNDLERIGARIEVGLNVLWGPTGGAASAAERSAPADDDPASAEAEGAALRPGVAFMRARQREHQRVDSARARAQALADELDAALGPCAVARTRGVCPSEGLAIRDQYLLERDQANAFRAAFDEVRRRHGELRFLMSGPWPPYSFVTPLA